MKSVVLISVVAAALISSGCGNKQESLSKQSSAQGPAQGAETIQGEIIISCYDSMNYRNFLEQAAQVFEEQNPGTKIKIETFSAMPDIKTAAQGNNQMTVLQNQDDPQGRADYISRVNTSLMSGAGADMYAMDILPLHKFVQNRTLENLGSYMETDPNFNKQDYRRNILKALTYHEGIWFLPLDYTFNYYAYDSNLVPADTAAQFGTNRAWNTASLLSLGENLYNGKNNLFNSTMSGMLEQVLAERIQNFADLEHKKANFLNSDFTGLLESLRGYAEKGYIPPDLTGQKDPDQIMRQAAMTEQDRYFFKTNNNFSLISQFIRSAGMRMNIRNTGSVAAITEDDEIAGVAADAEGRVPFKYNKALGINAESKNKALAWTFLKFLLSEEMQLSTVHSIDGLPVHNKARAEKAELVFSGAFMGRAGRSMSDQARQGLEQYKDAVETMSDQINCFIVRDSVIDDMILAETRYFLNGSRNPEEVARAVQNKTDLYLNE
jgi:multiple sugar transport system substrate-binding protein